MHGIYNYDAKNVWTYVRVENDTLITGYRQTSGWARTRTVYFAMTFPGLLNHTALRIILKSKLTGAFGANLTRQIISPISPQDSYGCILILPPMMMKRSR